MSKRNSNKGLVFARVGWLYGTALLFTVIAAFMMIRLNFVNSDRFERIKEVSAFKNETRLPIRGDIKDSNGNLLATTVVRYNVYFDVGTPLLTDSLFNADIDSLTIRLSAFNKTHTPQEYIKLIRSVKADPNQRIIIAAKDISPKEKSYLKTFPIFREKSSLKSGFVSEAHYERKLPFGNLLERTIGDITEEPGIKGQFGNSGLEGYYHSTLSGAPQEIVVQNVAGKSKPVSENSELLAEKGYDLLTAIDINLQHYAHNVLRDEMFDANAKHATLVVMETETGYIKSMVNIKNNGDSTLGKPENYAAGYSLAPGSTFKLPVLIAALEDGYIKGNQIINTGKGYVHMHGEDITDHRALGKITVKQVLSYSSNVGMSMIIDKYYTGNKDRLIRRFYDMGLNKKSGIDVFGERSPTFDNATTNDYTFVSLSFGYGLRITPLGLLTFYNAIANKGYRVTPRLVKAFEENGKIVKTFNSKQDADLICSKKTLKTVQEALEGVVSEPRGTAHGIKSNAFKIAGKTGTAKKYDSKTQQFINEYRASFVGYFPADKPKYSMIVVLYGTNGDKYDGGKRAAPVFKKVAEWIWQRDGELNRPKQIVSTGPVDAPFSKSGNKSDADKILTALQIPYEVNNSHTGNWITTEKDKYKINYKQKQFSRGTVPSVLDLGAKDAVFLMEYCGLNVEISGAGTVRYQSITPNTKVEKGMTVKLELR
ncbi:MAG: penicillin-binding protein [Bacteroidota bacterium]|nr:penicillin-binding protein [Bacteroidota bacterium]